MDINASNMQTVKHIQRVQFLLSYVLQSLTDRLLSHDESKLQNPEAEMFAEVTDKLSKSTYGSKEYEDFRKQLKPALDHHYANNRHHPEHFPNGINDMTLIDLVEMFCDWKASSERHTDGNILKSIDINSERFSMNPQLVKIFKNTATEMDNL